ncbi:hypothetical protein JAAARDRAFT_28350 [Jaapia argillacea MUCL 33604]|uniref:assimilatory sulfite reductase (NADPH) n=1 Tax=Jaapia argillacea MUCL 33604 TaxID=933084 RepID=A0A067QEU3_9AGAM|nr:hypothetical protein JAAARDRAFT_28350 [Jaapia argillacea MUCL 33604]
MVSGTSTPLTSSSTLTVPSSPVLESGSVKFDGLGKSIVPASNVIELISSQSTSTVFLYDLAEQVGFGSLTKSWADSRRDGTAPVVSLQTRSGAGLGLVGRLSQGTSKDAAKGAILTAYTTPTGLAAMAQSLAYLPPASSSSRLVIQVPTVTPVGDTFAFSPTLASLSPALALLPDSFTILLSATSQESVDMAFLSYRLPDSHVIHLFDHHSSSREIGHALAPYPLAEFSSAGGLKGVLNSAGYDFFDYIGGENAHTVFVLLNGPTASAVKALASRTPGLGVVVVRVLRPWDEAAFRQILPASVKQLHVFDDVPTEASQGSLYVDVFSAVLGGSSPAPIVRSHRVTPGRLHGYLSDPSGSLRSLLETIAPQPASTGTSLAGDTTKKLLFFSTPKSPLSALPHVVVDTFLSSRTIRTRRLTDHDAFSKPGGITADRIVLAPKESSEDDVPVSVLLPLGAHSHGEADFIAVLDQALLKSHSILTHAKKGSPVLLVTSWTSEELVSNLPAVVKSLIREKDLRLCTLDVKGLSSQVVGEGGLASVAMQNILSHLAFLRLYLGNIATESIVYRLARDSFGEVLEGLDLLKINARAWAGLVEVEIPAMVDAQDKPIVLKNFDFNAIAVENDQGETIVNGAVLGSWHDAAKHILFPSAYTPNDIPTTSDEYPSNPSLRPEIPDRTFLITTTVNRRLTPLEYDRNVFHIEFDTTGTGLKYSIGEALGIHGWNDEGEVHDFCSWYGVSPNRLVTIPVPGGDGKMHTRTVFQALQQQIDLFGKPPKSFYTDLAEYATLQGDKMSLQFIGSPEGSSTFKKLSEKDTVTFADVLKKYSSARPGIEVLCEMVGDIKPRHYSIASAQSVVGDRVDLLVVTVDWVTPSGTPRFGQCTRYLAGLRPGQKVTVSIKPSVMKLPPDNMQPLILAGLGTGAAPFRAFLQHRAWLASQNIPIGPIYYYFGSRHQSQEYLYGEEIEAFILDKTITKAGLAFSRDGPKKVYIQHKMLEDAEGLARMLWKENGVFYLCGPTWPVPDVYEALVAALVKYQGMEASGAGDFLEGLKEEERYVLEVY